MKSLEQRIVERAQNELRERISCSVAGLRNYLTQEEAETITHLIATDGPDQVLHSIDQVLNVLEDLLFKVSAPRYCDKVLDSTLASLEANLACRNQYGQPRVKVPAAPDVEAWKQ